MGLYRSIVVGTDGSDSAEQAVRHAAEVAKQNDALLHVVAAYHDQHQRERLASSARTVEINMREVAEQLVQRTAEPLARDGLRVETDAREGDPAEVLLDVAEENGADLIVVGNKGMTGARRFVLGSVPNKVSHHATASVLIVRTD